MSVEVTFSVTRKFKSEKKSNQMGAQIVAQKACSRDGSEASSFSSLV